MATLGGNIDGRETGQHDFMNWIEARDIMLVEDAVQWRAWAWCLASNLTTAAALCRAFDQGWDAGHVANVFSSATQPGWYPGCGRPSP